MPNNENPISIEEILKIAASPTGQQLMKLLQQSSGNELQLAAKKAAAGNYDAAKQALSGLLQDPEVKKLLDQLGR